ncbi:SidA/IucD/PvdA family monooxygenase [Coralliovum pocilloporae]|uniref:SidA/IucD/PvdA family monooxygenase n=1 Tax=Coralliovum pocilloporae TaxID=3066369 RepID=UPI003306DEC0
MTKEFDLIGVGFGPANIGLAVALEEFKWEGSLLFLEANSGPTWQPGMLLDGTDIQHNPLRDFATLRNPSSKYGFLQFLKEHDRLYEFLNLHMPYPLRKEYAAYVRWVAEQFSNFVRYSTKVIDLRFETGGTIAVKASDGSTFYTNSLSLAPGRSHAIPAAFNGLNSKRAVHFSKYNEAIQMLDPFEPGTIAVIGASQSAAEIILDISKRFPEHKLVNFQRNQGYRLKDTSPFTEGMFFPSFTDQYYNLPDHLKDKLIQSLWTSQYSAADSDVITKIHNRVYEQRLDNRQRLFISNFTEVSSATVATNGKIDLSITALETGEISNQQFDLVVFATGFKNFGPHETQEPYHPLMENLMSFATTDDNGCANITRDYRLQLRKAYAGYSDVFLNGLCESSHGFGDAGSFSLLSDRADKISKRIIECTKERKPRLVGESK